MATEEGFEVFSDFPNTKTPFEQLFAGVSIPYSKALKKTFSPLSDLVGDPEDSTHWIPAWSLPE